MSFTGRLRRKTLGNKLNSSFSLVFAWFFSTQGAFVAEGGDLVDVRRPVDCQGGRLPAGPRS